MSRRARAVLDSLRRNLGKFALATACGLVLGGMAHLASILMMPWLAERDALSRLAPTTAASDAAVLIAAPRGARFEDPEPTWLPLRDPAVAVAACAYDLTDGPLRVTAPKGDLVQTLSLHARGSGAYFAVTDRAAIRGRLDLLVMTRAQLDAYVARSEAPLPAAAGGDVRVVAPTAAGFVVVRALAPLPSQAAEAVALAQSVSCTIEPL